MCVRADPWTPASIRANPWTHLRLCLNNPRPHSSFLFFLSFAFGWSCGICLATPISTCKGRRGHKHFEGDPLAFFAKQKFKGCIYPLDACVFRCLCEDFQASPQKKLKTVSRNLQVSWLLQRMVWAI
jgi:hypothetical protein